MAITVNSILDKAGVVINDNLKVRWPAPELVDWINDAQREIVMLKPEASMANLSMLLTASSTKQSIPTTGIQFIDIVRNTGAAGTTPGKSIKIIPRELLDAQVPNWHTDANTAGYVQRYTYDPRDPKHFYVYPQAPATTWYVEAVYSVAPATIVYDLVTGVSTPATISLDDIYANMILNYVLYRCFSKDATYAGNAGIASACYQLFTSGLNAKGQVDVADNPART